MDTQTLEAPVQKLPTPQYKENAVAVFEVIDKKNSNYYLEDSVDGKTFIDSNDRYVLRNSYMEVWDDNIKGFRKRLSRYINGCDTPWVDEQDKLGYKPNFTMDVIFMKSGNLHVVNNASQRGMFRYLTEAYNENANVFVAEGKIQRPEEVRPSIRQILTDQKATSEAELIDLQSKAQDYLNSLRHKEGDQFIYNRDGIEFLCRVFKAPQFTDYATADPWVWLSKQARNAPQLFLNTIASERKIYEQDVRSAISKGVILIGNDDAHFVDNGKVILEFTGEVSSEKKILRVVDFMCNPENHNDYNMLRVQISQKQIDSSSIIN